MKKLIKDKKFTNFIHIFIHIFKMAVIVVWDCTMEEAIQHARNNGYKISEDWEKFLKPTTANTDGQTTFLGDENADLLVWLKRKPIDSKTFGVFYHEIYHVVDYIASYFKLKHDEHTRAYLYEFIVGEAHKFLWKK